MANKITILYESPKHSLSHSLVQELEKHGWEIKAQDLSAVNFAKRYWRKLRDGVWSDLATSSLVSSLPEGFSNWFRKQLIRPRLNVVLDGLRKFQPPIVLVTSYTGGLVMSHLKSRQLYRGKVVFMLEGFSVNPLWVMNGIDLFLCESERQAELLKQRQIDSSKCAVIKPDIGPEFFEGRTKEQAASDAGLLVTMPSILLITQSEGADVLRESFLKMIRSSKSFQVIVVCPNQLDIQAKLEKITSPVRHPTKFINNFNGLHLLLSAASVVVGPLSAIHLAQAAACKTPVILTDSHLMDEPENLRYLLERNAVTLGRIPAEVLFLVESILDGRKVTNLNEAQELLALPKDSLLLTDALNSVNPANSKTKN